MHPKKRMSGNISFLSAVASLCCGICCGIFVFSLVSHSSDGNVANHIINSESVAIPMTTFNGDQWFTPSTLSVTTLASNKYGQFQSHSVKTENGQVFIQLIRRQKCLYSIDG